MYDYNAKTGKLTTTNDYNWYNLLIIFYQL